MRVLLVAPVEVGSGETITAKHIWSEIGDYEIKVKARDIYDFESDWSDSFTISMPRNRQISNTFLMRLFERFPNVFPLLRYLIN